MTNFILTKLLLYSFQLIINVLMIFQRILVIFIYNGLAQLEIIISNQYFMKKFFIRQARLLTIHQ